MCGCCLARNHDTRSHQHWRPPPPDSSARGGGGGWKFEICTLEVARAIWRGSSGGWGDFPEEADGADVESGQGDGRTSGSWSALLSNYLLTPTTFHSFPKHGRMGLPLT